jgi:glycosyltransferase involved in cell wall biosynthesis
MTPAAPGASLRVARIISRLNIGGPAIQAITLTRELEARGYETLLIRGSEGEREGSMDHLAMQLGVQPLKIATLGRETRPRDLVAFVRLVRELRRFQPHIVHTHAAKAGTLGRLAALVPGRGNPRVIVHTFHGHSLTGYFSPRRASLFARIERVLARRTTRLIAVSDEVRDDLVRLGVAPAERFEVIRLGLDLAPFDADEPTWLARRAKMRAQFGIPADARVVTLIARLVPIKRVDRFLAIAERLVERDDTWFLIAGDGELRPQLESRPLPSVLRERLVWAGFQRDMPAVCSASDVVVLTSDNEGTPVSLIEAQAAGVPVVSTRVGGATTVVSPDAGALADAEDLDGFARAIAELLETPGRSDVARAHVVERFSLTRLVDDIDSLYRHLLSE